MEKLSWANIKYKYTIATNISTVPDPSEFPEYQTGDAIDEEMSVRWNREEIVWRNKAYQEERQRLCRARHQALAEAVVLVCSYIMQETRLNKAQATELWNFIHAKWNASVDVTFCMLHEMIELQNKITKLGKEEVL